MLSSPPPKFFGLERSPLCAPYVSVPKCHSCLIVGMPAWVVNDRQSRDAKGGRDTEREIDRQTDRQTDIEN